MGKKIAVSIYEHRQEGGKWGYKSTGVKAGSKLTIKQKNQKGSLYLSWYENGKKKLVAANDQYMGAVLSQAESIQSRLHVEGTPKSVEAGSVAEAVEKYLLRLKRENKAALTIRMYRTTLYGFRDWAGAQKLTEMSKVGRDEILDFVGYRRDEEDWEPRTTHNNRMRVDKFVRETLKLSEGLTSREDTPFVEPSPEVYSPEELTKFFAACPEKLKLAFQTFYMTGLRVAELTHLQWKHCDFTNSQFLIRPSEGFIPKKGKEREVPVPDDLMDALKAKKKASGYVFATRTGTKNQNWWWMCHRIAKRAGLDTERFHLHKFRATYITKVLRDGHVDLVTLQKLVGHDGLASTQRYWEAMTAASPKVRAGINASFGTPKPARLEEDDPMMLEDRF